MVVGRGLGTGRSSTTSRDLEGGRRTSPPSGASERSSHSTPTAPSSTSPGSRPTPSPARTALRLPTEVEWEKAATWDQETGEARAFPWGNDPPVARRPRQPGPARLRPGTRRRLPRRRLAVRLPGDDRRRVGVDRERLRRLPRASPPTPTASTREVFFGSDYKVLRGGSWATRARVITADLPQLGLPAAPPDLLRLPDREGPGHEDRPRRRPGPHRVVALGDARSARWPTTCSTGSPGRSRRCRPSTSTTRADRSCSSGSASSPSTTRRAPSAPSSRRGRMRSSPDRRRRARRARIGLGREGAHPARRDGAGRNAAPLRALRRLRERRRRRRPASWSTSTTTCRSTA